MLQAAEPNIAPLFGEVKMGKVALPHFYDYAVNRLFASFSIDRRRSRE